MTLSVPTIPELETLPAEEQDAKLAQLMDRCEDLLFRHREAPENLDDLRRLCNEVHAQVITICNKFHIGNHIKVELEALDAGDNIVRPRILSDEEIAMLLLGLLVQLKNGCGEEFGLRFFEHIRRRSRGKIHQLGCHTAKMELLCVEIARYIPIPFLQKAA